MPGWTIVNYHDVSREDSLLTRAIGGTVRPDVFRAHLERMASRGDLVSVRDGLARLEAGEPFERRTYSVWFDDGFTGVRRHALPICEEFGITSAVSINSRFVLRQEMFWRAQLSYLVLADGLRHLRSRLRQHHPDMPARIRHWTLENFTPELRDLVESTYNQFSSDEFRSDAHRLFDDEAGIAELADAGWLIVNHSAAHHPLAPGLSWDEIEAAFDECDALVERYNAGSDWWVIPFGYGTDHFRDRIRRRARIVHVGSRVNTPATFSEGDLYRHPAPLTRKMPW